MCSRGGHNREALFCHGVEGERFLEPLQDMREHFRMQLYAYCLMANHYHVLIGTPDRNISQGMQWLNGSYGNWFNKSHNRSGHLFGERFKAVLIENGSGLREASVYVHMNGVATQGLGEREKAAQGKGMWRPATKEEEDGALGYRRLVEDRIRQREREERLKDKHGAVGRDFVLWAGCRFVGLTLRELDMAA